MKIFLEFNQGKKKKLLQETGFNLKNNKMSDIGKIIRVNALPPVNERENNVIYQVAAPGAATYKDYAIDANGDLKTPSYIPLTGTEEGKPLTKNIEVDHSEEGSVGFISNTSGLSEAVLAIQEDDSVFAKSRKDIDNASSSIHLHHDTGVEISVAASDDQFSAIIDVSGLQGSDYVTPTSDEHYVQKKYVTNNFTSQTTLNNTLTNYYTKPETYSKAEVDAKFSAVYRPKGSVANFASLPATGNVEGDVWNLLDTGANVVWVINYNNTGNPEWDKLSETVDLTNYVTTNTYQGINARKVLTAGSITGNDYIGAGLEIDGNGSNLFPTIGFHHPGQYAATMSYRSNGFNFMDYAGTGLTDVNAAKFIKEGSNDAYMLLGGGGHRPVSDFALATDLTNVHKIDTAGSISNGSDIVGNNKTWFDYSWAGQGYAGSVINFSGLTGGYSTELFADYTNGNNIGIRTHNGDAANTWNPVRWLYHSGNFDPATYLPLSGGQLTGGGVLYANGDIEHKQTISGENATGAIWRNKDNSDDRIAGIGVFTNDGDFLHTYIGWGTSPWATATNLSVADNRFTYKDNDVWHEGNLPDYRNYGLGRTDAVATADLNNVTHTSVQDIYDTTLNRPFDYGSVWTHRKGGVEFTQMGVNVLDGRLYTRGWSSGTGDTGWQRNALYSEVTGNYVPYTGANQPVNLNSQNLSTTGTITANGFNGSFFNSNTLTGAQVFASGTNDVYFGNNSVPNVNYQTGTNHNFQVGGSSVVTINSTGLYISGNIQLNGQNVATQAWVNSQKGIANGIASLDSSGLVPTTQLPSYVDDVLEFANLASFPSTGETGKIYVAIDTNLTYRWSGSNYIQIASGSVQSVNGQTGVINLTTSNIPEGSNLYYTNARVKSYGATQWSLLGHIHSISDVTGLETALNSKVNALENAYAMGFSSGQLPTIDGAQYPYIYYDNGITQAVIALATQGWVNNTFATISSLGSYITTNTVQTISEDKTFDSGSTVTFTGSDHNSVLVHKTTTGTSGDLVSGHDYTHYDTRWRVGNIRGSGANSTSFAFLFSSDNGASYSQRVNIDSMNGRITTSVDGNSGQWNDIYNNGIRTNTGFLVDEDYREIGSSTFDIDDPNVKKFTIIFNDSANGHVVIHNPANAQYFQFLNISATNSIEIEVQGYGVVDSVAPGKTTVYMSWGGGKLSKISENSTVSII